MSSQTTQKRLATVAGITAAAAQTKSGADLIQAALANAGATPVGAGLDGARFEQIVAGQV